MTKWTLRQLAEQSSVLCAIVNRLQVITKRVKDDYGSSHRKGLKNSPNRGRSRSAAIYLLKSQLSAQSLRKHQLKTDLQLVAGR